MRKWIAALVISTMALTAGCGQKDSPQGAGQAPSGAAGNGPVTINYYGRPDDNQVESTIIKAFEDSHPDIKVNYVELPDSSNDRLKTINTVLQAGDASIDVFAGDVVWPPIFASAGWVIPFDEYLADGELDDYLPGPLSAFQIQGKTYGLPFMADAGALYYRKDLLDKYGKEVPGTWEELIATAQDIVAQEGNPELKGFVSYWKQNESLTSSMLEIYWEKGARVIGEDGGSVIDEALLAQTLTEMKQMMDDGVTAPGIETFGTKEARDVMCAGDAVFARDWLSGYGPFNNAETSRVAGNVELAPLPSYGCLGGWGVMVSNYSKNKPQAVEFAKFRANYESQMTAFDLVDIKPTLKSAYEDETLLEKKPELPQYLTALEQSRPSPQTPFYAEISGIMQLEIHSVITGMSAPADSAKKIVEQVNQILQ
ncbi:MAG: ABC transporter substrate-binding protein [Clostridium sp.]|nr:ABC transporter substrate-binding protein [Clostridium sp.]